jgi:prepilin-type N-terminal cleavage/methylation domain-containing protein
MKTRRGFTLIEIAIAIVMLSIVLTGALRLFRSVNTAVTGAVDRMDAMQNLRFGLSQIDLLVRNAGAGTTDAQPTLIYIGPSVVAFNADWISLFPGSPTAVNYNPDADPNASNAVTVAQKFTIPTSAVQYPDSTYRTSGGLSPAETIVYYFELDTSTTRSDDFHLMRQVNNNAPDEVARNFLPYPGKPFFDWLRTDDAGNLQVIAAASLPMRHANPIHGSLSDTSMGATGSKVPNIDSIRAVRVSVRATNGLTGSRELLRDLVTTVRIPNAGLTKQRSCGDVPIFTSAVGVALAPGSSPTAPKLRIGWVRATDEATGEKDVERYLIYRRTAAGAFDDALVQVPAGQVNYTYDDPTVVSGETYVYGVTALDCTPLESSRSTSAAFGPVP